MGRRGARGGTAWGAEGRGRTPPDRAVTRARAVRPVGAALTPLPTMAVPYLPHSTLRQALPWRAPIAWGISKGITDADPAQVLSAVGAQLMSSSMR
ncbi:hypothetical protein ABB07_20050 [Streptomyces incarnatus]|uniref:Uncharacterized protein n=2 Tax=Streptomyces incarnatus TaxID=665007 RepID=A0ABM5TMV8_9ACTN|nr:hypothetical protein ABB07_20050 [Streptomyces incarnatus]